ncbi:glycosyltransferase family 2 protein [Limnohabitans sp. 2KL-27]|jgi:glycosyltransferase involved in cell wall biosynthesis|uniref:glycosyltransferase family 2 protein n=1 Tax=Limnohabitans sp. 2KL-27 TaxID=1100705 RepID=UPI000A881838|nr:glycosyltransferase family 2 protein [Limnohabitans sp. 2KL-27]
MIITKAPVISIVTSVLNSANSLRATFDSIIPQLNSEVEYIVIDGGSTDGTKEIISEYVGHLAYWVSERDSGIYDAWNKGLTRASGRYIGFVGADDILLPGSIYTYLSYIRRQPEIEYWSSKVVLGEINGRVIGKAWRWENFRRYMTVAHVGSLQRRDLYDRFGVYNTNYRIAGDYEFLLRIGEALKAGYIDKVTAIMGDGGVSNKFALQTLAEAARAKKNTDATSKLETIFDYYMARLKLMARSLVRK